MASVHRTLKRIGAGPKHVDTMIAVVMDALADGPRTQQDLLVRAKARGRARHARLARSTPGAPCARRLSKA